MAASAAAVKEQHPPLRDLLKHMAENGASDLFVSVGAPIKFKINGVLRAPSQRLVTSDDVDLLLSQIDNTSRLEILDKTHELNCALSVPGVGRFRLSAFVQRNTKAFVIRYIPPDIPRFESLGLPQILKDLIMLKRGLILTVGPTGSGKSTTLASLINYRNEQRSDHIFTIEDPIEYLFRHASSIVNQRELGSDAFSYHDALRNAMRQAPDVILIGEIRDRETMSMAMQYAQSGHLCLATLHANNAYQAVNRIVGFFPPEQRQVLYQDLASSLKAVFAQRLIPTIEGGFAAAVEILINSRTISECIARGDIGEIPELMERSMSEGTQTFEQVLIEMIKERRISVDNALIYSDSPTNLFVKVSQLGLNVSDSTAKEAGVDRAARQKASTEAKEPGNGDDLFGSFSIKTD
jgi:twitching motility protein PilU